MGAVFSGALFVWIGGNNMDTIDLKRWVPSASDSRKLEYAGARTAQEVYEELKHRLESTGYLPDEYFLLNAE